MIPTLLNARAIVLRRIRGRFDACRQFARGVSRRLGRATLLDASLNFAQVCLPILLLAIALLGVLAHPTAAIALPLPIGATTGTKSSGTDFTGLNDMLKTVYTKSFENNVERDQEVSDVIMKAEGFEVHEGPDGKSVNMNHDFSAGGGVMSILEDDYLPTPTVPTSKQSSITIKQHTAIVQLSGRALRRVKKGPAAFVTWATEALPRKARRLAFQLDRQRLGTGTGIVCRYNANPPSGTGDAINAMFGISGLDDRPTMLLLRDDSLRCGPNADGSSLRSGTAIVAAVHYGATTIDTTVNGSAGAPTAAAQNDYIFLGDANVQGAGSRELTGLEAIIDDGTNVTSFQGITTRSTYPELCSQIVDATATGFDGTLSEEVLDLADSYSYERGNMGRPSTVLVNRSGQRSFWKNMKKDQILNDPRGAFTGGVGTTGKAKLKMMLGDRVVTLQAARKVPASRAYGIDGSGIQRYCIGSGHWDDTDGSIWNRVVDGTGRKDAFFAVWVQEEEMGAGNPAASFKITNLAAA